MTLRSPLVYNNVMEQEKSLTVSDIKKLNIKQLKVLSEEIRKEILACAKNNGGHLASNLGIVELTLALHYVFSFPEDKLIFDVGHQCYTHKYLTRCEKFSTIRTEGGLSGFPDIFESEYDAFSAGHAGTALSAGLGYCYARDKQKQNYYVISVVGDGSFANGLSLEALTSATEKPNDFLAILNDNGMSISKNNTAFYKAVSKATTKKGYSRLKKFLRKIFGDSFITRGLIKVRNFFKRLLNKNIMFDQFGLKYVGIVDGNDIKELVTTLRMIKNSHRPTLLHVDTKKGKGYADAEEHSDIYHGVSKDMQQSNNSFSNRLGETLTRLAEKDEKIVAICAAMKDGTGLKTFEEKFPKRFIDVGICEEHAVTMAGAMSLAGVKPVVAIYSTFMQRSYDQLLHDVCMQKASVVFCLDRAGVVGSDGQSHQGTFDLTYLSSLPNMTVFAPKNLAEFDLMLSKALTINGPVAIRYPNGVIEEGTANGNVTEWETSSDISAKQTVLLAVGPRMNLLANKVAQDIDGVAVVNARVVKPLDNKMLDKIADKKIVTLEENSKSGGFGSAVLRYYSDNGIKASVTVCGIKDDFVKHASVKTQLKENGLDEESIKDIIKK